jgi:hypothetical protein
VTVRAETLAELSALEGTQLTEAEDFADLPERSLTPLHVWASSPETYNAVLQVLSRRGFICTDDTALSSSHVLLDDSSVTVVCVSHTVKYLRGILPVLDQRVITSKADCESVGVVLSFWEQLVKTPVVPDETLEVVMRTWDALALHVREATLAGLPRVTRTLVEAASSMENPQLLLKAHKALRRALRSARLRSLAERGLLRTYFLSVLSPISGTSVVLLAGSEPDTATHAAALLTLHETPSRPVRLSRNAALAAVRYLFIALPLRFSGQSVVCYDPPTSRVLLPRPLVAATTARPILDGDDAVLARTSRLAAAEALWLKKHTGSRRISDASAHSIACSVLQGGYSRFPESWISRPAK